jgi:prokaryotic ubiquitin-like protein Pup
VSGQEQKQTRPTEGEGDGGDAAPPPPQGQAQTSDAEVDALLDEIDDVLETNAEEFVKGFVQKGGQ